MVLNHVLYTLNTITVSCKINFIVSLFVCIHGFSLKVVCTFTVSRSKHNPIYTIRHYTCSGRHGKRHAAIINNILVNYYKQQVFNVIQKAIYLIIKILPSTPWSCLKHHLLHSVSWQQPIWAALATEVRKGFLLFCQLMFIRKVNKVP